MAVQAFAMKLDLPWPPKELSPNARVHWAKLSHVKKKYKNDCMWICKGAKINHAVHNYVFVMLHIKFCPPDKRLRDTDNCIASFKAGQDGLAEALGVNAKIFNNSYEIGQAVKHGKVEVTIS